MARRKPKTIIRYRKPPKKKRRRRRKPQVTTTTEKVKLMAAGAAVGFVTENVGGVSTLLARVPQLGTRQLTNGIVLAIANKYVIKSKWADMAATAALCAAAHDIGQARFRLSGAGDEDIGWDGAAFDADGLPPEVQGEIDDD